MYLGHPVWVSNRLPYAARLDLHGTHPLDDPGMIIYVYKRCRSSKSVLSIELAQDLSYQPSAILTSHAASSSGSSTQNAKCKRAMK